MTPEQRIAAADRAREVLDNEAFIGAFAAIEQEYTDQWKNSPARDAAGREAIWSYLALLRKLRSQLTAMMETGQLARADLQHQQSMRERLGSAWSRF